MSILVKEVSCKFDLHWLHFPHADTSPIIAPRNQIVIYGRTDTLNCSYADASVNPVATVERDEGLVENNEIISATLDDEGDYECDIFLPQHSASIGIPFTVHVIGKLSFSPLSSHRSFFLMTFFNRTMYCWSWNYN